MTSRQLVIDTLEFHNRNRVPRQLWVLPWAKLHYPEEVEMITTDYPSDIVSSPPFLKEPLPTKGKPHAKGLYVDEWGCTFENCQEGIIGEVKRPIFAAAYDLDALRIPVEKLTVDTDAVDAFCRNTDKFVLAGMCARPFEQLQFIRGTENLFMDIATDDSDFKRLLETVHHFYLSEMQQWVNTNVDGLFFMDDWGTQRSLLISPAHWRKYFKPLYKQYVTIAHENGKKAFMHSDGYILDILPDLVEIGLDAINSQIFCMGIDALSERFSGKITFWGEIDRQSVLPHGTREAVFSAVKSIKEKLYAKGGCIAQCEFGPGAKPENVRAVFESWE